MASSKLLKSITKNSMSYFTFILLIVFISWVRPSSAKNSVWSGTINECETTKAITVNKLKDGGQSIKIYENGMLDVLLIWNKCFLMLKNSIKIYLHGMWVR